MSGRGSQQQQQARLSGDRQLQAQMDAVRLLREQGYRPAAAGRRKPIAAGSRHAAGHVGEGAWGMVKAGLRGGVDSFPFELGDSAPAALHALGDVAKGRNLATAYRTRLAAEHAQNRYDEAVHPGARTLGKVAGTIAQMAVPGVGWANLARGRRMVEAAPLIFKEGARLTGLGAAGGAGMQGVLDVVNQRLSSVGDYAGSALGGAATVMTALGGRPGYAGGVGGAVTSLGQDAFNGRIQSARDAGAAFDRAAGAAAVGNLLSFPVGMAAARVTQRLPNLNNTHSKLISKGDFGEALSLARSRLRGQKIADVHKKVTVGRKQSVTDHRTVDGWIVEAKLGPWARLSKSQKRLRAAYPDYRVDHFLPTDVGSMAEVPMGVTFAQWPNWNEPR